MPPPKPPKWQKSPPELIRTFLELIAEHPDIRQRPMFGYPAGFVNGNMCAGLFQKSLVLRLPPEARAEFLKIAGAAEFEPMPGRKMREYVVAPPSLMKDRNKLGDYIARARGFAASLPPKEKPPRPKAAAK